MRGKFKMINKLRRLTIKIIEDIEEHINECNNAEQEPINPFNEENWYLIEDKVYDILHDYLVGKEE